MENIVTQGERDYLRKYLPQMECAVKHGYYTAIPSVEMKVLSEIYKRHINSGHIMRLWCSACCLSVLRGLYELARREMR